MLNLIKKYLLFNLSAGMEYKTSFLIQVFGMALNNSAFIFFWLILFNRVGDINGYGFQEVMLLWALISTGFGLCEVLMGNGQYLSSIIYKGELDVYLLQPRPLLPNLLCSRMNIAGWGDILYGLILFTATQIISSGSVFLFILMSILSALIFSAMSVLFHSLTFFLGNAENLAGMAYNMLITLTLYPGSIFKGPILIIMHSLIPAGLVAWMPAELIADFSWKSFAFILAADALFIAAACTLFYEGLKRYASGNKMGSRI